MFQEIKKVSLPYLLVLVIAQVIALVVNWVVISMCTAVIQL